MIRAGSRVRFWIDPLREGSDVEAVVEKILHHLETRRDGKVAIVRITTPGALLGCTTPRRLSSLVEITE